MLARPGVVGQDGGVEGAAQRVGGDEVHAFVADPGGGARDGVHEPLQAGP